jgi:hypothetical protein
MTVEEVVVVVVVGGTTGGGAMFLVTIEHWWNADIFNQICLTPVSYVEFQQRCFT